MNNKLYFLSAKNRDCAAGLGKSGETFHSAGQSGSAAASGSERLPLDRGVWAVLLTLPPSRLERER
jgi:hypothetical protein